MLMFRNICAVHCVMDYLFTGKRLVCTNHLILLSGFLLMNGDELNIRLENTHKKNELLTLYCELAFSINSRYILLCIFFNIPSTLTPYGPNSFFFSSFFGT